MRATDLFGDSYDHTEECWVVARVGMKYLAGEALVGPKGAKLKGVERGESLLKRVYEPTVAGTKQ